MNGKKKILVIEDNEDLQEIYRVYLEEAGFEVLQKLDGLMGLTELVEKIPDVILLDIMMPQMNGFEVLDVIKNQSSFSGPIIVCSNLSQERDVKKAY